MKASYAKKFPWPWFGHRNTIKCVISVLEGPFKLGFLFYFLTCCFQGVFWQNSLLFKPYDSRLEGSFIKNRCIINKLWGIPLVMIISLHETIHVKVFCKQQWSLNVVILLKIVFFTKKCSHLFCTYWGLICRLFLLFTDYSWLMMPFPCLSEYIFFSHGFECTLRTSSLRTSSRHCEAGSLVYPGSSLSRLGSNSVVIVEFYYIKLSRICNNLRELHEVK